VVQVVLVIVTATLSPFLGLALLLWLAHLEDTLPRDVRRAATKPAPEPILAIPVRAPATPVVTIPEQRATPDVELASSPVV
jgi:hypothetical protein